MGIMCGAVDVLISAEESLCTGRMCRLPQYLCAGDVHVTRRPFLHTSTTREPYLLEACRSEAFAYRVLEPIRDVRQQHPMSTGHMRGEPTQRTFR